MNLHRTVYATHYWIRDLRRRPLLLILLVITPVFFITRAIGATEPLPKRIGLPRGATVLTNMRDIHGASMAAITVAFLGGLVGVFIMQAARQADQRLVLAGYRGVETVTSRLLVLIGATLVAIGVSLAVTARDFTPHQWGWFAFGTAAVGITYAALGALGGALLGRVAATYVLLIGSMLDIGVVQNPMFGSGTPPRWAVALPGYPSMRVINTAAFSHAVEPPLALFIGTITWLVVLLTAVIWILGIAIHERG